MEQIVLSQIEFGRTLSVLVNFKIIIALAIAVLLLALGPGNKFLLIQYHKWLSNGSYEHKEELVKLGYLVRRDFHLTQRGVTTNTLRELTLLARRTTANQLWRLESRGTTADGVRSNQSISVIARPEDMQIWERIIAGYDSTNR